MVEGLEGRVRGYDGTGYAIDIGQNMEDGGQSADRE